MIKDWLAWLNSGLERSYFQGASLAVLRRDQIPLFLSVGSYPSTTGELLAVNSASLFDCASVTKSIPTGLLALQALQENRWRLDTRVVDVLPEFKTNFAEMVKLRHLLTHTLDYRISMSSLKDLAPQEIWDRILNFNFEKRPGESYLYCNATSMILGLCIERVFAKELSVLAQERIFGPLGMSSTSFAPIERGVDLETIVPTENCPWRVQEVRGRVHDESSFALLPQNLGSAGLFSTTQDLSRVLQSLLDNDQAVLNSTSLEIISRNHIADLGLSTSLGFEFNAPRWMGAEIEHLLGKTGFTGATIAFDPVVGVGMVLLCNWTWPTRKPSPDPIFTFRKEGTALLAQWAKNQE